jgi:hypothetical protein
MDAMLKALEQFGVSAVIIAAFMTGSVYILRRLFNAKDGILTIVGQRHIKYLEATATLQQKLTTTNDRLATSAEQTESTLSRLADRHEDENSSFATVRLHRSGIHACDVIEKIAEKLEIGDAVGSSIDSIRRELSGAT